MGPRATTRVQLQSAVAAPRRRPSDTPTPAAAALPALPTPAPAAPPAATPPASPARANPVALSALAAVGKRREEREAAAKKKAQAARDRAAMDASLARKAIKEAKDKAQTLCTVDGRKVTRSLPPPPPSPRRTPCDAGVFEGIMCCELTDALLANAR